MKKEILLEIMKMNNFYERINESVNPTPTIKFVKNLVKDVPEGPLKKLFSVFGQEEEDAYKVLQKTKNKAGDVEAAVEKLVKSIDYSALAAHLLENKKLGTQIDAFINRQIELIEKGSLSKDKAVEQLEDIFSTWTRNEGLPELGPELVKKVESKLESVVVPDFAGVLNQEVSELFKLTGKKLSTADAKLLNGVYDRLFKLKPQEIIQVEEALKRITSKDGVFQQAITRLRQAKDTASQMKAENMQKGLDKAIKYLNIASTSVGKVKILAIFKAIVSLFFVYLIVMTIRGFNNIKNAIESFSFFGFKPFASSSSTSESEPAPEPNNTEPNKTEETW
jgi:hypothetical protein